MAKFKFLGVPSSINSFMWLPVNICHLTPKWFLETKKQCGAAKSWRLLKAGVSCTVLEEWRCTASRHSSLSAITGLLQGTFWVKKYVWEHSLFMRAKEQNWKIKVRSWFCNMNLSKNFLRTELHKLFTH